MRAAAQATPQIGDPLHYQGSKYTVDRGWGLTGSPVEPYFKAHPEILSKGFSSACMNGHYSEWTIRDEILYLDALHKSNGEDIPLSLIFTNSVGPVPATWFTGELSCPRLRLWPSYNAIGGEYAYWLHFNFQKGRLEKINWSIDSFLKRLIMNTTSLVCGIAVMVLFVRGLHLRRKKRCPYRCAWWCLRLGFLAFLVGFTITAESMAATLWNSAVHVVGAAERAMLMLERALELRCLVAASIVAVCALLSNAILDIPRKKDQKARAKVPQKH